MMLILPIVVYSTLHCAPFPPTHGASSVLFIQQAPPFGILSRALPPLVAPWTKVMSVLACHKSVL